MALYPYAHPYAGDTRWYMVDKRRVLPAQGQHMVVRARDPLEPVLLDPPAGWLGALDATDSTHGKNIAFAEHNGLVDGIGFSGWDTNASALRGTPMRVESRRPGPRSV